MAKKKKDAEDDVEGGEAIEETREGIQKRIIKDIEKSFGKGVIINGNEIIDRPRMLIPVSPAINQITGGGIPEGSWVILSGKEKIGKAQPLFVNIFTPTGPIKMGHIKVGDKICNSYGSVSEVIGVYPQGFSKVYRVYFADGDYTTCSINHLWDVYHSTSGKYKTCELKDIENDLILKKGNGKSMPKWRVKLPNPCQFNSQQIDIDPYILGILLGDGGFSTRCLKFTNTDDKIWSYLKNDLPEEYELKEQSDKITSTISNRYNFYDNKYIHALKKYHLFGKKSKEKFIPDEYKYNTIDVRIAILQGLMDTDGYCSKKNGSCVFYTSSIKLASDVKEIVNSLGGICVIKEKYTTCNEQQFKSWAVIIRFNDNSILFRISRKKSRTKLRTKPNLTRGIVKIEYLGEMPAQCIETNAIDHLYLTDNYIVTHNTVTALHFAKKCQQPEYGSRNVYFLNVEGRLKKRDLLGNIGLDSSKIHVVESTEDKILTAEDYLQAASNILYNDKRCVIIIDSISQLCEQRVQTGGVGTQTRGSGGILVSQFTSQMGPVVNTKNSIVICILQHRNNTSGYGGNLEKGGWAIQYQVDVKLIAQGGPSLLAYTEGGDPYGHIVTWKCTATGVNFPPNRKCESYVRYGEGIDEATELIHDAKDMGLIGVAGSWLTFDFLNNHKEILSLTDEDINIKIQGAEKARKLLQENPKWMSVLQQDIINML